MLGDFGVSVIHQILAWATGSGTHVCDPFAHVHTEGTLVCGLILRTSVESALWRNLERGCKVASKHVTVTHPCNDQAQSCSAWLSGSKRFLYCVPQTPDSVLVIFFFA